MRWKKVSLWFSLFAFVLVVADLVILALFPNVLEQLRLTGLEARLLLLQLISLILLFGGFQGSLGRGWRWLCLTGSFLVLAEATLMGLLLP